MTCNYGLSDANNKLLLSVTTYSLSTCTFYKNSILCHHILRFAMITDLQKNEPYFLWGVLY
jgi:hypothetical protein